uniref:RING-type domain-containing protein n=1 Tax=Amphiprion percula TaxID=161767 RepID=A0A3P8S7B8_AMPPE
MSLFKPEEQLVHELSCPICLQLYSDPVVLPCGHNYCRACICMTADTTDKSGILPRCPECREEYQGMDSLQRNFKLSTAIRGAPRALYECTSGPVQPGFLRWCAHMGGRSGGQQHVVLGCVLQEHPSPWRP